MDISQVKKATALIQEAHSLLNSDLNFYMEEMVACYELLMTKFAPFRVGDRIALSKTPQIDEKTSWGWMGAKHFLKEGALGVVREASCGKRGFTFRIEFEDESWLYEGKVHPAQEKHLYSFGENYLRLWERP